MVINSIYDFIEMIREEGMKNYQPSFYFAEIISDYPNIRLKLQGFEVETSQIKYTAWVKNIIEDVTVPTGANIKKINFCGLHVGDTVLVKFDNQNVLIIDKVVD